MKLMMSFVNSTEDNEHAKQLEKEKHNNFNSEDIFNIEETHNANDNSNIKNNDIENANKENKWNSYISLIKKKHLWRKNLKLYDLSPSQSWILLASMIMRKRASLNNATLFILNKKVDISLLNEAIKIELQRNDAFKIRITRFRRKTVKQYFVSDNREESIKILNFSNKKAKKMNKKLQKLSRRRQKIYNVPLYKIYMMKSYDNKYGIYSVINNLIMDDFGITIFYKNIMYIYDSLKNGRDTIKPLNSYEDILQKELVYEQNITMQHKTNEFWKKREITEMKSVLSKKNKRSCTPQINLLLKQTQSCSLNQPINQEKESSMKWFTRIKIKIEMAIVRYFHPKKALQQIINIEEEKSDKIFDFCAENKLPFNTLVKLCIALFLYGKDKTNDEVCFLEGLARRKGAEEKHSGGRREVYLPYNIEIDEEQTFMQLLQTLKKDYRKVIEYDEINPIKILDVNNRYISADNISYGDIIFTYHPVQMKFNYSTEYTLFNNEIGLVPLEITVIHNSGKNGGLDFYYKYRIKDISLDDVVSFHETFLYITSCGMENPNVIIKNLLKREKNC